MPFVIKISFFLLIACTFLCAQGIAYNQEFQVNTYYRQSQMLPSVSQLSDSGFIVSWTSFDQDGSSMGVYAQIFENDGKKRGEEFHVNSFTNSAQVYSTVTNLIKGGFIVTWVSYGQDGSLSSVYGQLYNNKREKVGDEFKVNTYSDSYQYMSEVAHLEDGGFIVCWASNGQDSSRNGVYAQIFNEDGSKRNTEFKVNDLIEGDQQYPCVSGLTNSRIVICWESNSQDQNGSSIYGKILNLNGEQISQEFQISTPEEGDHYNPRVTALADSGFIVCWKSWGENRRNNQVYFQMFDKDGIKKGNEHQVKISKIDYRGPPEIVALENGRFIICLVSDTDILCQLYNHNGETFGKVFQLNEYDYSNQVTPKLCVLPGNGFVGCWSSYGQDSWEYGIFAKYFKNEPIVHNLSQFSLLMPENNQNIYNIAPEIRWQQPSSVHVNLPWELQYTLYLDDDDSFSTPTIINSVYDTTYVVKNLTPGTTYFWKVLAKNITGDSLWSSATHTFIVDHNATAIKELVDKSAAEFTLRQNYPNPFNPSTTIAFELASPSHVLLKIFDLQGRQVALLKDETLQAGQHQVVFNAGNLASGVYYYMVQMGDYRETKKMLLLK